MTDDYAAPPGYISPEQKAEKKERKLRKEEEQRQEAREKEERAQRDAEAKEAAEALRKQLVADRLALFSPKQRVEVEDAACARWTFRREGALWESTRNRLIEEHVLGMLGWERTVEELRRFELGSEPFQKWIAVLKFDGVDFKKNFDGRKVLLKAPNKRQAKEIRDRYEGKIQDVWNRVNPDLLVESVAV